MDWDVLIEKIENNTFLYKAKLDRMISYLNKKENILFLTTSNRWEGHEDDTSKSTQLAY